MSATTHPDWLPQTEAEQAYVDALYEVRRVRDAGGDWCRVIREQVKPLVKTPINPDGKILPVRADTLAISVREGWV